MVAEKPKYVVSKDMALSVEILTGPLVKLHRKVTQHLY